MMRCIKTIKQYTSHNKTDGVRTEMQNHKNTPPPKSERKKEEEKKKLNEKSRHDCKLYALQVV